jgi:hypothetical protein
MEGIGCQYSSDRYDFGLSELPHLIIIFFAVREVLPQLMGQIIFLISGSEFEQQEVILSQSGFDPTLISRRPPAVL